MFLIFAFLSICSTELPEGHLKPLGEHSKPLGPAAEEDFNSISSEYFYDKYVATRTPVILRGLAKTFPAYTLWTDDYIKEHYGDLEVRLEAKTEKETYLPVGDTGVGRSSFRFFLNQYNTSNMYCVSEVPEPMYKELVLPAVMNCGSMKDSLEEMNMWINSGGAKSIIHKDAHNQLNCLLHGTKEWIFISDKYNDGIYQAEEIDGDQGGFSLVNPDRVNYITFPKFAEVPWTYTTVHAGDCLFLPPRYYHRVKSHDRNYAVSFLFGTSSDFEMGQCDTPTTQANLSDVHVTWRYPGHGVMSMGNSNPREMRESFIDIFDHIAEDSEGVTLEDLADMFSEWVDHVPAYSDPIRHQILEVKGFGPGPLVTRAEVEAVSMSYWVEFTALFSFDPSNSPDNEYWHYSKQHVLRTLTDATYWGKIDRAAFVKAYNEMGGSPRKGGDLFSQFSTDGLYVSWTEVQEKSHVLDVFGAVHDRGDSEMHDRNDEVKEADRQEAEIQQKLEEMQARAEL